MMKSKQSRVLPVLLIIGVLYFLAFWPINAQGARDRYMISVFEPDEFAQYSHPIRMLDQPGKTINQSIYRFTAYQHYYYGYPFYFYSAMVSLLPLKAAGLNTTANIMLLYRQLVSVLPMIAALILLVYLQTKFRSYGRSIALFLFLLTVPAVINNDIWWHPESLVFLFIVLTFIFLEKDNLSFGKYFYFSAIACGLAVATKLIGLFFFLAIPTYIFIGWRQGRMDAKSAIKASVGFVAVMVTVFVLSSPFLFYESERIAAFKIQARQADAMSAGFVLAYAKGPATWVPLITEYYAQPLFLVLTFISLGLGIANKEKRLLNLLILVWALPFALYLLFFIAIKPKHFFLPILLPVFSALPYIFDWLLQRMRRFSLKNTLTILLLAAVAFVSLMQIGDNLAYDLRLYTEELHKEEESASLKFFSELDDKYLSRITLDRQMVVYRDVRMYVADRPNWEVNHRWGTTDYSYIERLNPDIIVLWKQRLYDYTNEGALERALEASEVAEAAHFYRDALDDNIQGYKLIYEDDFGSAYLSLELYQNLND